MNINPCIFIAHASWSLDREKPLQRLIESLDCDPYKTKLSRQLVCSEVKEHSSIWAKRLYERAIADGNNFTHFVFLNDDITVCSGFAGIIKAMIEAVPDQVMSLHTVVPQARTTADPWLLSYLLSGPAYLYPREDLIDLQRFYELLPASIHQGDNEDGVGAHHAWSRQKPIWQSVPALVEHDVSVPSTLGYDNHPMRKSLASFDWYADKNNMTTGQLLDKLNDVNHWKMKELPKHVAHPWMDVNRLHEKRRVIQGDPDKSTCVFCQGQPGIMGHNVTGSKICLACAKDVSRTIINIAKI
jgi:hypothetical protein